MGFRFFRRIRLAPGLTLNLSKSGASISAGPRGAKVTVGPRGVRKTVGLPGTGIYYTTHDSWGGRDRARSSSRRQGSPSTPPPPRQAPAVAEDRLNLGFFDRLATPKDEEHLVDGLKAFVQGREGEALGFLRQARHLPDAAWTAGLLALKHRRYEEAEALLQQAADHHAQLGRYYRKYQVRAEVELPITETITAHIHPDLRGTRLALAEVRQARGQGAQAAGSLRELLRQDPADVVVRLSLVELLVEAIPGRAALEEVVRLTRDVENESACHTALLLHKGQALAELGLLTAARDTLTNALRRSKDRPAEPLRAVRYQRALVYEALGESRRCRAELERVYAEDPGYEDVAARLGLGRR